MSKPKTETTKLTLQEYIEALSSLPEEWRNQPHDEIKQCWLGDVPIAAYINQITAYDKFDKTWKDPSTVKRFA